MEIIHPPHSERILEKSLIDPRRNPIKGSPDYENILIGVNNMYAYEKLTVAELESYRNNIDREIAKLQAESFKLETTARKVETYIAKKQASTSNSPWDKAMPVLPGRYMWKKIDAHGDSAEFCTIDINRNGAWMVQLGENVFPLHMVQHREWIKIPD